MKGPISNLKLLSLSNRVIVRQGGDVIRLFHKEIEAYLCVEGNFGSNAEICSDGKSKITRLVHLMTRRELLFWIPVAPDHIDNCNWVMATGLTTGKQ